MRSTSERLDERLVAAATLGAAGRARDVLRQIFEMLARELDHLTDGCDELRVVVVLVRPLAVRDFVGVVITRRAFVEFDGDVLFVDLHFVDVFEGRASSISGCVGCPVRRAKLRSLVRSIVSISLLDSASCGYCLCRHQKKKHANGYRRGPRRFSRFGFGRGRGRHHPASTRARSRGPAVRCGRSRSSRRRFKWRWTTARTSPPSASALRETSMHRRARCSTVPTFTGRTRRSGETLRTKFSIPVFVANDARCATLGEFTFGTGKGTKDFVLLTLGTGIGGGIVGQRRALMFGNRWGAGEIGHHQIRPTDGFVCGCGKIGCFEAQASGTGLIRHAFALAPSFPRSGLLDRSRAKLSSKKIRKAAQAGDGHAMRRVEQFHRRSRARLGERHRFRQPGNDCARRRRLDGRRLHDRRSSSAR